MSNVTTLGLDIAKNVFQLHGVDQQEKTILRKKVNRNNLLATLATLPPCLIGMEACGSAHYWAREIRKLGHCVKLMSPQYVKPYIKTNKNDPNDAEGICEAVSRPTMRFVSIKSEDQQNWQMLHRVRSQHVKNRTALMNHIRGLLAEYGIVMKKGAKSLCERLVELMSPTNNTLNTFCKTLFENQYEELIRLNKKIKNFDKQMLTMAKNNERCQRLMSIPGIKEKTATAFVAAINDGSDFKNGRCVSAWLGVIPKQNSSGEKQRLLSISKRGDRYLRWLFIHGARSVVSAAKKYKKPGTHNQWILQLLERCHFNTVVVAVANKNIRMAWAVLKNNKDYQSHLAHGNFAKLVETISLTA